jgi:hypothetical protein
MRKILLLLLLFPVLLHAQRAVNITSMAAKSSAIIGYYRTITIPSSLVSNTTQTNFPVTINATVTALKTVSNGGHVQNSSGYDITFALDSFGNSQLNWDMEQYVATTGQIVVHVKIPSLVASANTVIYMKYGNAAISTYQGNTTATWDANFLKVLHFNETLTGASQTVHDYTSNAGNLTSVGTWAGTQQATGEVGPSLNLINGNGDYFNLTSFSTGTAYTIEGWYKITVQSNSSCGFGNPIGNVYGNSINFYGGDCHLFSGSPGNDLIATTTAVALNTWTYVAFTVSGTTAIVYLNGVSNASTTSGGQALVFQYLGQAGGTGITSTITYDEMRVSTSVRSADWIKTSYNIQANPSSITVGSEL